MMEIVDLNYIPPSSIEIEKAVLGAILIESSAFERIDSLSQSDFYSLGNSTIFSCAKELYDKREPIDALTVINKLKERGELENVGGAAYLSDLMMNVASSAHIEYHANIIKKKAVERNTITISQKAIKKVYEGEIIEDVIFWQGKELENQQEILIGNKKAGHISAVIKTALSDMYKRIDLARENKQTGITTGLMCLDKITGGWQNSDLIIIAARPAMGKTAFALKFAKSAAASGVPVVVFSLEMSDVSIVNRLLLSECNIDSYRFKTGKMPNEDSVKVEKSAGSLYNLPIEIDDSACITMSNIRSKARLLNKQGKCGMVVIDYLQLVSAEKGKGTREQEIAQMSREAKMIAKELNIPVILLSQLSRKVEERTDKRPMLSDLRESGAIEQDADMVCFIHRPEYYGSELNYRGAVVKHGIEFNIAKYRNGATGGVVVQHDGTLNKIFDEGDYCY